jgi:hypothetical protein
MFSIMRLLALGCLLAVVGCAATGGWQGAEAEKAYDKALEIKRLAAVLNNDDYYEFERDGRIYVLSDAKEYTGYLVTGEIPLSTKKIGGGPGGKTIVYGLVKSEAKLMEKDPKTQGAAQKMFEGNLKGMEKDFFGLVIRGDTQYVFSSWKDLEAFRSQDAATGFSEASAAGGTVVYVNSADKPKAVAERYAKLTPAK